VGLLWTLIAVCCAFAIAAGTQALLLVQSRDGDVLRMETQMAVLQAQKESAERQVEAEKLVILEAKKWIEARAAMEAKAGHGQ
jgi:hypothetical protein